MSICLPGMDPSPEHLCLFTLSDSHCVSLSLVLLHPGTHETLCSGFTTASLTSQTDQRCIQVHLPHTLTHFIYRCTIHHCYTNTGSNVSVSQKGDKPTENAHQFPSALWSVIDSFCSLFWVSFIHRPLLLLIEWVKCNTYWSHTYTDTELFWI